MNILATIPDNPLTEPDEQRLALAATETSHEELTMRSLHQALPYSRKVCKSAFDDSELLSVCYAGLMRAARCFKPAQKRYFAFAKVFIRSEVYKAWRSRDIVKNAYEHQVPLENGEQPKTLLPDSVQFEFGSIHVKELWEQIAPVMEKVLTEQEKTVFTLRYAAGYTFAGIGKLLGVSGNAAEGSHARALKKIRRALSKNTALFSV